MISYRLTSLVLGLFIAGIIITLVRKDLLNTKLSIIWFAFAAASAVFGMFPQLNDWIARDLFGVNYAPVLFIVIGIGVILIKILTMDIERSKQDQNIRELNEKIAVLEGEKYRNLLYRHNEPTDK